MSEWFSVRVELHSLVPFIKEKTISISVLVIWCKC